MAKPLSEFGLYLVDARLVARHDNFGYPFVLVMGKLRQIWVVRKIIVPETTGFAAAHVVERVMCPIRVAAHEIHSEKKVEFTPVFVNYPGQHLADLVSQDFKNWLGLDCGIDLNTSAKQAENLFKIIFE